MTNIMQEVKNQLNTAINTAVRELIQQGTLPDAEVPGYTLEVPGDRAHGDLSANIALAGARAFKMAPAKTAAAIRDEISLQGTCFEKCEVAGPGFLNFYYSPVFYADAVQLVREQNEHYGESDFGKGEKVLVEFVSANPTGPMHIGNARGGALGDCLAAVLKAAGYDTATEFYVNDAGNQLEKFGLSLDIRYRQLFEGDNAPELPEDSYHGDDIKELARQYADENGDCLLALTEAQRRKALTDFGLPQNIKKMKSDMAKYGIVYDKWFYESELHSSGAVDAVMDKLKAKGLTYEKEDAVWYKTTAFGAEKDEVLIRSNGKPTYFAADIAYHKNKFDRGFAWLIDCWGADHHGHVARMKAAMNAVDENGDKLDIVLYQLVNLLRDGQAVRMSKRTGKAIQLADLLDEVSRDAVRFTFNLHEPNISMDFDLDLAVKEDAQNPVYYVQYAHARICSILRNLKADGITPRDCTAEERMLLHAPEEKELIRHIASYPDEIVRAAEKLDPSCITKYVINLATLFHKFYNACRVKGTEEPLMQARLSLCTAAQTVIRNVLTMFQVSVPDSM